ncbi:hypothetical protein BCR43DRAFT_485874 [Syncephalastrum racemosum]|uniref:Peroxisomal membrane protein PEX14-like KPWE domain-containing protein n=1 Tax=Syncephalastrum racemosum TaxID=13706 RepID=A0A1X2HNF8_SYNRA|nr:hypothetical protein BCR43DRAFT_485874 [Syncephalastrum racemosum]
MKKQSRKLRSSTSTSKDIYILQGKCIYIYIYMLTFPQRFIQPLTLDELRAWKASKEGAKPWSQRQQQGAAPGTPTPSRQTYEEDEDKEIGIAPQSVKFTFQELVEMIESGQEIPGIKQIPNKINEGAPSEPKMSARRKPWEQQQE